MPFSTNYFKEETKKYIQKNFQKKIKILDVGAGAGTYSDLLKPLGFTNIDCVEVFEDYVNDFELRTKYSNVIIGDITKIDLSFNEYDLIILGDVLEHISESDAIGLINKIGKIPTIIGVPFESEQGEHFGNVYETHLQSDLTLEVFLKRFINFHPFCLRFDYGIFINQISTDIFFEHEEKPIPKNFLKFVVNNYPDSDYIFSKPKLSMNIQKRNSKTTIVTGLWDLGRGEINNSFKRSYDDYKEKFSQLLKTDVNMYIFCDSSDEEFIWTHRSRENTVINLMSLDKLIEWFNFTEITNEIRQKEEWISQSGWIRESPQATLKGYNPLVMSKMFMLNNVTIWNPFNSDYFFWLDAGITNTVHYGYFTHDKVLDKLPDFIDENKDFVFLTYPYIGSEEIHGFPREAIARYANTDYVKYVCRGGFFGGKKERINEINGLYYSYLSSSLNDGYMGTEESVFSIVLYNHSDLISQYNLHEDGLVWRFFEDIKDNKFVENVKNRTSKNTLDKFKTSLYVLTFNSPKQFETLIESMIHYDGNFIDKPKKYLLNNSTDDSTFDRYEELCAEYEFVHIKKDNLGICGGRQFIAEHFDESDSDYMFFFEDDMFFYPKKGEVCRNGFNRFVDNFYHSVMDIIHNHNFDFLKFNYSEFFGDNGVQWSWYNVPQSVRDQHWPNKNKLPVQGLDPNAPRTKYKNIRSHNGIPFIDGEVYYSNWPQVVSKEGNKKMFIETTWAHPFEQTWMSYIFQETIKGRINPALLLMTPTEHNRFDFYAKELRKES